jgi:hypothetical protein
LIRRFLMLLTTTISQLLSNWYPIAAFQVVDATASLDLLAHGLVAKDVADLHCGNVSVVDVQVGAADGAGRDLNDDVAHVLNLWIGHPMHQLIVGLGQGKPEA